MAIENPFMVPRKLDGSVPDVTHRRGWADAAEPTRLTRFAEVGMRMINRKLAELGTKADDQYGTDQIPLNEVEQQMVEMSKGTSDLEAEAGVFGVDQVLEERLATFKQGMAPHMPMELTPLDEEMPGG
jgi:hypothetical protein